MLGGLRMMRLFSTRSFQLEAFSSEDYRTMCALLKEKYSLNNEEVRTFDDIKLLDQSGKLIGLYSASEARKKATSLGKDMVLVSGRTKPVVCKAFGFRNGILDKFYDEVVLKRNSYLLSKATSQKTLRIQMGLNASQMQLKVKQVMEIAKKHENLTIEMICRSTGREECLETLEKLKSDIQNNCFIEKDISQSYEDEALDKQEKEYKKKEKLDSRETYSFRVRSRDNSFLKNISEYDKYTPEEAIRNFLKRYYKQSDADMLDLKQSGVFQADSEQIESVYQSASNDALDLYSVNQIKKRSKESNTQDPEQIEQIPEEQTDLFREAKARLLNQRIRKMLEMM